MANAPAVSLPQMRPAIAAAGTFAAIFAAISPAHAQTLDFSSEVGVEFRIFPDDPLFPGQEDDAQISGFAEPELFWRSEDRDQEIKLVGFGRIDSIDDERSHLDLREAYYRRITGEWEVLVGVNRVFWGVAESRHLVNVINQIDAVEDTDEEDFLGQPMVQIARQTDIGRFEVFYLPRSRERTFPGVEGRLRAPFAFDTDAALYESGDEEWRASFAGRYSHFIGPVDIGLSVYHGTGREPNILPGADGATLLPLYPIITQGGIDVQYTADAWLWKLEAIVREGQGETFAAAVAGVEYTLYQIFDTDADLGLIAEGLYDGRDAGVSIAALESGLDVPDQGFVFPTIFDQDVFLGARLALNDVQDTSVLAGVVFDVEDGPAALRIEAERRLGSNHSIALEAQGFLESDPRNPASLFQQDTFINLRFSRFF